MLILHETFAYDYVREPLYLPISPYAQLQQGADVYMFTIFDPTLGLPINTHPVSKNTQITRFGGTNIDHKVLKNA